MERIAEKQKQRIHLSSFVLHILAMAFMLCDHLWGTFLIHQDWLGYVGRIAYPLFAFLLVEGLFHTGNTKRYILGLLAFALISEIPFNLMVGHTVFYPLHQNVLWTHVLSGLMIVLFQRVKNKQIIVRIILYALLTIAFYLLGFLTFVDYYGYGLLTAALFYFTRRDGKDPNWKRVAKPLIQLFGMYWINCEMMKGLVLSFELFGVQIEIFKQGLALLALPLIWLYHGKQGPYNRCIKSIYYWFYPVHVFVLGLLISIL